MEDATIFGRLIGSVSPRDLRRLVGAANRQDFGRCAAGTLLLFGATGSRVFRPDKKGHAAWLWVVDLQLHHRPSGHSSRMLEDYAPLAGLLG